MGSRTAAWLASSLTRQFPAGGRPGPALPPLYAARGERVSFQACLRHDGLEAVEVQAAVSVPRPLVAIVRRVGLIPQAHHTPQTPRAELDGVGHVPGLVPDPLYPETAATIGTGETISFWVTVSVPPDARPSPYRVAVALSVAGRVAARLATTIRVAPLSAEPLRGFPVTHWFWVDSLCDRYALEPFSEAFWTLLDPYLANYAAHGSNTLYTPLLTPPLHVPRRPTQLLGVTRRGGRYRFDWSRTRRWIAAARRAGIESFEWSHWFSQWGCKYAPEVLAGGAPLWPAGTPATSGRYRTFLAQLLPEFARFLEREGVHRHSWFHISDEPHGDAALAQYRRARAMLRELAPWMEISEALSDLRFAQEGLVEHPVPILNVYENFRAAGIPAWAYFCCYPRGRWINRLFDTPLAKVRATGWALHRLGARGFLHWGYNYWHRDISRVLLDPYQSADAGMWPGWSHGDPFVVYPGPAGPIDSIRWEVFAESIQDLALLRTLHVDPDDPRLAAVRGFDAFPRSPAWAPDLRRRLLLQSPHANTL